MSHPLYDVIVYGASGFTGAQAARWMATHAPAGLRWAIAGRSRDKLRAVREELGSAFARLPLVVADAQDTAALDALVRQTRVVASFAGPYARHGSELVAAVARQGRRYCDITGETLWVRRMVEAHGETAATQGACIVPFCGFDSLPSELGVLLAVGALAAGDEGTSMVRSAFVGKGGFNGGTLASAIALFDEADPSFAEDPFLLCPPGHGLSAEKNPLHTAPRFDPALGTWVAPFFMAPVNGPVVRWTATLMAAAGQPHGEDFGYAEGMKVPGRMAAMATAASLAAGARLLQWVWLRDRLAAWGPAPGEGPSEAVMDGGFFTTDLVGIGEEGGRVRVHIAGEGDPGNRNTVRMACAAALTLAEEEVLPAGILPPGFALGNLLVPRLRALGMKLEVKSA